MFHNFVDDGRRFKPFALGYGVGGSWHGVQRLGAQAGEERPRQPIRKVGELLIH